MHVVRIIALLLLCRAAEFTKRRNGSHGNRMRNCGEKCRRGRSSPVKRFSQFLDSICSESLYENEKLLTCQDKQLNIIPRNLPEDVIHLQLAGNKIKSLKMSTFSTLTKLKSLDLQRNSITNIEPDAFEGLDNLETLLLQHNQLKFISEEIFIPIPKLQYLRIYGNPWNCSCDLEQVVRKLQIPGQRNLGNLAKCKAPPGLAGYKLKTINVSLLCSEDRHPAPFQNYPDSTKCNIYLFPKSRIDCQNKELAKVPTDIPPDVLEIDLSRNKIKQLSARNFMTFQELETLNLSNNALTYIHSAAFVGLLRLKELDLSQNYLYNFQYGVLEHLYFIKNIVLTGNPWKCDYQIHYLAYWLQVHYTVEFEGLQCKEPSEYEGWTVQKYVKKYYEGCPKEKSVSHFDPYGSDELEEEGTRRIP